MERVRGGRRQRWAGSAGGTLRLSREQLVALLEKRDRQKKLGLVWERDEIEADAALEAEFASAELLTERSDPAGGAGGCRRNQLSDCY